ncbi:NHL repeat-containing protein [Mucilaginibacter agri]|uniref:NHL repeat containing protein n=1 Tax=Mucilaginibacter agri TaxID=2695265 RepID=A0A965ZJS1_9SPHI|nr:hypothetical protein [Mucilaginibacter agri]NCD70951.1 hypothetical protein [Mucilaginibacter agri]
MTLVIDDTADVRVRNLVSETWYPAGDNVVRWDGLNDLGRDADAANHGIYSVSGNFINPGKYRVRGIIRNEISAHYEFSFNYAGSPPWGTDDHTGGWLANHSPPQAALYLPGKLSPNSSPIILLGCYVSEGVDGFAWVDLKGKKLGGKKWIGGAWTSAPFIAADNFNSASSGNSAYVASIWEATKLSGKFELRLNALSIYKNDFKVIEIGKYPIGAFSRSDLTKVLSGLGVYDNIAVVSLIKKNQLIFIDTKQGHIIDSLHIESPKGVMIDSTGRLMLLSGNKLIGFKSIADALKGAKPQVIIGTGLDDPFAVIEDYRGNFYITNRETNTVKVFNAKGGFLNEVGTPGPSKAGKYNPLHMNNPAGLCIDEKQQLWVTEEDYLPKRVSVWTLDGKLIKAFYGPSKYGGGGTLDPSNKNKAYYSESEKGTMEFTLDWQGGKWEVANINYRPTPDDLKLPLRNAAPETPIYFNGRQYFTNCYTSNPTNGHNTAVLFIDRDGVLVPVAAMGKAADWDILKQDQFKSRLPEGVDLKVDNKNNAAFFIWQDSNANGHVEPEEVACLKGPTLGITIMPDLSFCIASLNGSAVKFSPLTFTDKGIPQYNLSKLQILSAGVLPPASSGGAQVLSATDGWNILTLGVKPYSPLSISGIKDGSVKWTYPDLWPGLHASHRAPVADQPGMLIGTTRLLGEVLNFKNPQMPSLWAINGNHGNVYIFTDDGLFVTTVFRDKSIAPNWRMKTSQRNMRVDTLTLGEENFFPTITKTADEKVYMVDGARSSIVRLDGLETIRRLSDSFVEVLPIDIQKIKAGTLTKATNQNQLKAKMLDVTIFKSKPVIDGVLADWNNAPWVQIDNRGFTMKRTSLPVYDVSASLGVYGDRIYGMYCTGEPSLLQNSGEMPVAPFKTGGALDLMIGTSSKANPNRGAPVAGDCRLIITVVNNKPMALLYRAVVPGTPADKRVPFSSPSNTVTFDRVDDVTSQLEFAAKNGNYEFSIPLSVIGIKPYNGLQIKGDIGILRGKDGQTVSRIYWSNKATGLTSDVPSEAMLTPNLWGTFIFKDQK